MTEEKMQPYPSMGVFAELVKQEYKGEDRDAIIYFAETTCAAITQMGGSAAFARPSVACTSLVVGWPGPSDESNLALLFQKSIKRVKVVLNEIKTSLPTHVVFVPAVPTRLVGIGCMEITDVSFSVQDEADGAAHLKVDRDAMMSAYQGLLNEVLNEFKIVTYCPRDIVEHGGVRFSNPGMQELVDNALNYQPLVAKSRFRGWPRKSKSEFAHLHAQHRICPPNPTAYADTF